MRLLWFNLATDERDPLLASATTWVKAVAKRIDSIDVITMRAGDFALPGNVRVHSVGKEKGWSEARRVAQFYRHLFHVLRDGPVDGCFSHMMPTFTVLAAPVLRGRGIPIVTWYAHPRLTMTLKAAHYLSDLMVSSVLTAFPYRKDKLVVVGHGIDTNVFASDGSPPESPPLILCAGRLSPVKDHPTLLRAVDLLRRRLGRTFRVLILGGPAVSADVSYVQSLQRLVVRLGIDDIVGFSPPVETTKMSSWYKRCWVLVNLTPTGSGDRVAWEAMACGRPCLAANEGYRETFGTHALKLLFRHGDHEELSERLVWMLRLPPEVHRQLGAYLRKQVVQSHSLDRLADRLVRLFAEDLGVRG